MTRSGAISLFMGLVVAGYLSLTHGLQGGHFAVLEQPELFLADIEEFVKAVG